MYDLPIAHCDLQKTWISLGREMHQCAAQHQCEKAAPCPLADAFASPPVVDLNIETLDEAPNRSAHARELVVATYPRFDPSLPPVVDLSVEFA